MDPQADIARWVAGRRAAEVREREDQRDRPIDPRTSFSRAAALIALAARRHGWPLPPDPQEAEDGLAYQMIWARLRRSAASS